jgi:uncharacterized protein (TIGR03437 family)
MVAGFVARLSPEGSSVEASALLNRSASIQFAENGSVIATSAAFPTSPGDVVRVRFDGVSGPVAACTLNGASFARENFVAPGQLLTVKGGLFTGTTRLLFDSMPAPLLYAGPNQINAVVPRSIVGQATTLMEIETDGVRSNARLFAVRSPNPTVKVWIAPDGSVDNRGSPLADVALSDGSPNTEDNPAHPGEVVTVFTTGLDLTQPISVELNFNHDAPVLAMHERPESFGSVVGLDIRMPDGTRGVHVIRIINGSAQTPDNPGFIWVQ